MHKLRITPRLILWGIGLHLSWRLLVLMNLFQAPQRELLLDLARVLGSLCAYGLAFIACWRIADEYRETKWMRLAWLALTVNAGLSLIRPFARPLPFWGQSVDLYYTPPAYALFLHCILMPANLCLLLGLLAIWWAYHETGLGFHLYKRDVIAMSGLLALMLTFFVFSDLLTEARAYYRTTSVLQLIAQVQMFLIATASLLLHRVANQLGSGKLAKVLRWMMIYSLFRLGMVLSVSIARHLFSQHIPLITDVAEFGWQAAPWLFALAVAYRAELTDLAAQRLADLRQQRHAPLLADHLFNN